jgi:CheY-like chemotaxis protein
MIIHRYPVPARVLLVDDEPQQLAARAHVMKMYGFSVTTACGPIEAIFILEDALAQIDVAILDYDMPIMNGCTLASHIRSMCPELKIILYSGAVDLPQPNMTGVDVFIPKGGGIGPLLEQVVLFAPAATAVGGSPVVPGMLPD